MTAAPRLSAQTVKRLLLLAVATVAAWSAGLVVFATRIPDQVEDPQTHTDAIVVLTGGSGRLDEGLNLLARDLAGKLFVSGVYQGVDVKTLLQVAHRGPGDLEPHIAIGDAVNTVENAAETAAWMAQEGFTSLRLVTASYHMPRSLLEFHHAMPHVSMIPHPVFPEHVKQDRWWAWPGTAALLVTEYNKLLVAWLDHRIESLWGTEPGANS